MVWTLAEVELAVTRLLLETQNHLQIRIQESNLCNLRGNYDLPRQVECTVYRLVGINPLDLGRLLDAFT